MDQRLKIVGGVLLVGVVGALPFARRAALPEDARPSATAPAYQVPLHLTADAALVPSPAVGLHDHDAPPAALAAADPQRSHLEDTGVPPQLPELYRPLIDSAAVRPAMRIDPPRPPKTAEVAPPAPQRERKHRVIDGDTLERIAQRYWNDASLAEALFLANRDVLRARDPLPLGIILRIPEKPPRTETNSPAVEELPAPVREPAAADDDTLVPIVRD